MSVRWVSNTGKEQEAETDEMNRLKTVVLQHWKRFHEHWKAIETVNVYRHENVCNVEKSTFSLIILN